MANRNAQAGGKWLQAPPDLLSALRKNKKALLAFEKLSPSHKREYVKWVSEAKREETRTRRIESAVDKIASGML